tara:strand:+ start:14761 stop:16152 length:1392 start_codon:yes stop_codon:yes gene_type:complete
MDTTSKIMSDKEIPKSNVKMALALSSDGMPVHIDNAINGKACNLTCIGCGCPVIAKNRGKVAFHYSHDPKFYDPEVCNWSPETELHLMAKMVIAEDQKLHAPVGTIEPNYKDIHFEDVKLEKRLDNRIPDVIAYANGELIIIEIAVTHPCETDKISEMRRGYMNCVEIDLSEFYVEEQTLNLNTVRKFIHQAPIKWLSISPVGDIGQVTYSHNFTLQRELATRVKSLSEELQTIEAEEYLIRKKHKQASDNLNNLLAKIDEQLIQYKNQNSIVIKNKTQLERLRHLDEELERFATDKENFSRKIQSIYQKEQALSLGEASIRKQKMELNIQEQHYYSSGQRAEKESKIKSELEAELQEKKIEVEQELFRLNGARRNFDKILDERVEERVETIKNQLHFDAQQQKARILDNANGARKRTLELIEPLPARLKEQFDKARSFTNPPYEVIEEVEEIIYRLSKRTDT